MIFKCLNNVIVEKTPEKVHFKFIVGLGQLVYRPAQAAKCLLKLIIIQQLPRSKWPADNHQAALRKEEL